MPRHRNDRTLEYTFINRYSCFRSDMRFLYVEPHTSDPATILIFRAAYLGSGHDFYMSSLISLYFEFLSANPTFL